MRIATATARMVSKYRDAGFSASARFLSTFAGTFVTVKRHGDLVLGAFAKGGHVKNLAIPAVPVCE